MKESKRSERTGLHTDSNPSSASAINLRNHPHPLIGLVTSWSRPRLRHLGKTVSSTSESHESNQAAQPRRSEDIHRPALAQTFARAPFSDSLLHGAVPISQTHHINS
jgi:hypothetical protein